MWPTEEWANRLYDGANWALIVGLVLGAVATVVIVWMGKIKEEYLSRALAATTERAAHAEDRAAQANKAAEAERLARVRIEEKLGGWRLDAVAQERVIAKLKAYKSIPFDLGANPTEVVFMETIDGILSAAGWRRLAPNSGGAIANVLLNGKARINYVSGIFVEVAPSRLAEWTPAARALEDALQAEGIKATLQTSPLQTDANAIHIVIGSR